MHLRQLRNLWTRSRTPRSIAAVRRLARLKKRWCRLLLESLEGRLAPAVFFNPVFGNEAPTQDGGAALQSPGVYLIFWGSYWGGTNSAAANAIKAAANNVLSTPYLRGLTQYHSDGLSHLETLAAYDSSNPGNGGFGGSNIDDVVQNQIDNGPLPESDTPAHTPIYVVVTPPGIVSNVASAGGFNQLGHDTDICGPFCVDYDDIPEIWISSATKADGTINQDVTSLFLSHEVAEIMSDLGGGGYKVNPGPAWAAGGSGNQIGDYEGNSYGWRQPNGTIVQPFWSKNDNRWLAQDGNSQALYLTPQWNWNGVSCGPSNCSYSTKNILNVGGDQRGVNYSDTISIGQTAAGGVQINLNGEITAFDPGQITVINVNPNGGNNTVNVGAVPSGVTAINVSSNGGNDTVNAEAVPSGVTVFINKAGSGSDVVNLSPTAHNLANIRGRVDVNGTSQGLAQTSVNVYDQNDHNTETYAITNTSVSRGNAGPITFGNGVANLAVYTSTGANQLHVPPALSHTLDGFHTLTIDGGGASDLILDDGNNSTATTYTVTAAGLTRSIANQPLVTVNYAHLKSLTLDTGWATDIVNVESTPAPTTIAGGGGADTFNVGRASHTLDGINGALTLHGGSIATTLTVNDQATTGSLRYTITAGQLKSEYLFGFQWLLDAIINYDHVASLGLNASNNGANTVAVESTAISTRVNGGAATSSISISPTAHNLDDIRGLLDIYGAAVTIYDQANLHGAGSTTYALDSAGLKRTAGGVALVQIDLGTSSITLDTSASAAVVTISDVEAPLVLNAGAADTILVWTSSYGRGSMGNLTIDAHGGSLTLDDSRTQNENDVDDEGRPVTQIINAVNFTVADRTVNYSNQITETDTTYCDELPPPCHTLHQTFHYASSVVANYTNVQSLTPKSGPVATAFVVPSTAAGTAVTINAGANQSVQVGNNSPVRNIHSGLMLNGQGTGSALILDNSQATTRDQVTVTPSQVGMASGDQFFGTGGSLSYSGFTTLALKTSNASDDLVLLTPSATTAFTVNGSAPPFQAGHPAQLALSLAGVTNPINMPGAPGAGQWTFGNRQPVTYTNAVNVSAPATHFVVSGPASSTAGGAFALTVAALDALNQPVTGYRGTIHLASPDAAAFLPSNYTFVAADNGVHTFAGVILKTAGTRTVTATDTAASSLTGTSGPITVSPAATAAYQITAPPATTAGSSFNVTITAQDAYGNTTPGYTGTVHFTSSDSRAILPGNSRLANGTGNFNVVLETASSQSVAATDTVTNSITSSAPIAVSPATATHYIVNAPATATAGNVFSVMVTARDAYNNTATGYTGRVHFTTSDALALLPADAPLTNGTGTFNVILKRAATQIVTVTDTVTSSITGNSGSITVSPAAAARLHVGAPGSATAGSDFIVSVIAQDPYGNTTTSYTGTVHFTSSDGQAILPGNSALTNGTGTFGVTLKTAVIQSVTATDTVTNSITGSAPIAVSPATATHYHVNAPAVATAGNAISVTVTALDAYNNTATAYAGTVRFTSNDPQASLPGLYTFTLLDLGTHVFTATLYTAGTQSLTATDTITGTITGTSGSIMVSPPVVARLGVSAPASATAGAAFNITVTAQDAFGNTTPGYTGTVTFSSQDPYGATLPAAYTFQVGDMGTHTFAGGTTLYTAGTWDVTATDLGNAAVTGSVNVTVTPAVLDHFSVTTSVDGSGTMAGNPFDFTVTAQDAYNNAVISYAGTVTFSSQDPYGASVPADYTFQPSDQGTATFAAAAILYTAGTWDVTATDTATGAAGSDFLGVTAAAAVAFQVSAPASAGSGTAFDVTIIAVDPYGNTDTNYQGTVTWTSTDSDPGVLLPADYTFQASDAGMVTFAGGVTLITLGDQTLTATDTTSGINGSVTVTVAASGSPQVQSPHSGTRLGEFSFLATSPFQASSSRSLSPTRANAVKSTAMLPGSLESASTDRFFAGPSAEPGRLVLSPSEQGALNEWSEEGFLDLALVSR